MARRSRVPFLSLAVRVSGAALLAVACASREAEVPAAPRAGEPAPIRLLEGLGDHHVPITTRSPEAQRYFDQGIALSYGFNHDAAVRSFREAARLDPACAMCPWGEALALGPNINAPMGPDAGRRAYAALQRALPLAGGATPRERDLIEALATRYAAEPPADRAALDRAYADAMREVARRHPGDLDVATLFAESLMDLNPWKHWTPEGEAVAETPEIVTTLESVLARHPNHPGAIHLYIHAVEASPYPEKAEAAADRLRFLVPAAGHLVHMPSHIYIRVGRYADAFDLNERAAAADESFLAWCRSPGIYRALYYPHNLHFIWSVASFEGRQGAALAAARKLVAQIPNAYEEFPFLEDFVPTPSFTMLRFGMWDAVLAEPAPPARLRYATGIHHYARGLARLRLGDAAGAAEEQRALDAVAAEPALAALTFFGGSAAQNLAIASHQLSGEIGASRRDWKAAIADLEEAVRLQDALAYTEPPPWYLPERQVLGAVLLDAGRAKQAEAVYRRDLEIHPRNGWSLFGLARSLAAQGLPAEADWAEQGFARAWVHSDVTLAASRF